MPTPYTQRDSYWRVERQVQAIPQRWVLAASFSLPSGSRETDARAAFAQKVPLAGTGPFRVIRVR